MENINNIAPINGNFEHGFVADESDDDELLALMQGASDSLKESYEHLHTELIAADAEQALEQQAGEAEDKVIRNENPEESAEEQAAGLANIAKEEAKQVSDSPNKPESELYTSNNRVSPPNSFVNNDQVNESIKPILSNHDDLRHSLDSLVKSAHKEIHINKEAQTHVKIYQTHSSKIEDSKQKIAENLEVKKEELQSKTQKLKDYKGKIIDVDHLKKGRIVTGNELTMTGIKKSHKKGGIGKLDLANGIIKVTPERAAKLGSKITVEIDGKAQKLQVKAFTEEELKQFEAELEEHFVLEQQIAMQTAKLTQPKEETMSSEQNQAPVVRTVTVETRGRKRVAEEPGGLGNESRLVKLAKISTAEQNRIISDRNFKKKMAAKAQEAQQADHEKLVADILHTSIEQANLLYDQKIQDIQQTNVRAAELYSAMKNVLLFPLEKWVFNEAKLAEVKRISKMLDDISDQAIQNIVVSILEVRKTGDDQRTYEFHQAIASRTKIIMKVLGPV